MRKASVFLLLIIVLYGSAHYIVYMTMRYAVKQEVKHQMKHNIKEQDLETFVFDKSQDIPVGAKWEEEGKEFTYRGRMYDIVRKSIKGSIKTIWCINDTREASLKSHYMAIFQNDLGRKMDMNHRYSKSLRMISDFLIPICKKTNKPTLIDGHIENSSIENPIAGFISIISPPPQITC